jgi:hypothetical protein
VAHTAFQRMTSRVEQAVAIAAWSIVAMAFACSRTGSASNSSSDTATGVASSGQSDSDGSVSVKPQGSAATVLAASSIVSTCSEICRRSQELRCKNAHECEPNCRAMAALKPCRESVSALFGCLVRQPLTNWECAEDGVAAIREGFCEAEQARAVGCMEDKLKP